MFKKILIANRGEIACRVIKTARKMGIKTVAVYSDADRDALHVDMADEAVHLGPPPAVQSYLLIDKIVEACKQTGAEAVHPGYGFLSEREAFPIALEKAGIVFIGPNPKAIAAMGDKIESKKAAAKAKVSTVPGYMGEIEDEKHAVKISEEIGYPVMMKASAGGGGKGMRIAFSRKEVEEGFPLARSEAKASFGDDRMFIEKFIVDPRHIEIQLIGDKHGNVIYLGERECSIQRRNQKVIEEAPSPLLDEKTRRAMGEQAVALAKAVGYDSAGTVEFVAGQDKSFYFLEMNTRLQVEHPVTEMVTGIDIVREQLRIAQGLPLSFGQDDLGIRGHAIEARLYAEDPASGFLPQTGTLLRFAPPAEPGLRVDAGVTTGSEVSPYFDPMIAKVIAHAPTREEAAASLARALERTQLFGLRTNRDFLVAVLRHPAFLAGNTTTRFLEHHAPAPAEPAEDVRRQAFVIAALIGQRTRRDGAKVHGTIPPGWRNNPSQRQRVSYRQNDQTTLVQYERQRDGVFLVQVGDSPDVRAEGFEADGSTASAVIDGLMVTAGWARSGATWWLQLGPWTFAFEELPTFPKRESEEKVPGGLRAPMPGKVVAVRVTVGQRLLATDAVAILEAMKMEHRVFAGVDGIVRDILVREGDQLNAGDLIAIVQHDGAVE
jgi:propionyl-CoA carboxylase alpha chain